MRLATILAVGAAVLVVLGGLTGDLSGSDDLMYLQVARRQATGSPALAAHPFHARPLVTVPVAALLASGTPLNVAWRIPGAVLLIAAAVLLARSVSRRAGPVAAVAVALVALTDATIAEQARTLGSDLPAAVVAVAGLALLLRAGRRARTAAAAGALVALSLTAKETPVVGLAALAVAALAGVGPRVRWRAFFAGAALVVLAETALWWALSGDPSYVWRAVQKGHNETIWATANADRLEYCADSIAAFAPLLAVLGIALFAAPRHRRSRAALVLFWVAGGVAMLLAGSTSLTAHRPLPPLPRMLLPFMLAIPLAVRPVRSPRVAAGALAAVSLLALANAPAPALDPLAAEREVVAQLRSPHVPHYVVRTDERTATLLAYLEPELAHRLQPFGPGDLGIGVWTPSCGIVTVIRGYGPGVQVPPREGVLVWTPRWLHFLHHAYQRPYPLGFLTPASSQELLFRTGPADRGVWLARGEGAEIRFQHASPLIGQISRVP